MDSSKIHALGCDLSGQTTQEILTKITSLKSLAFPAVCLPDLHVKKRTEGPSSFAAATKDTIVPELTAPSVGCGMGLVLTNLSRSDVDESFFETFYESMRGELGPRYGFLKNFSLWLGLSKRPRYKYDITEQELEEFIKRGASAAIKKYHLSESTLEHVEYNGSTFTQEEQDSLDLHKILPRSSFKNGLHDLGYGFKGNHFLEIQFVEDIVDEKTAAAWGLKQDQIVIMYHGGGGIVPYHVGRYYGNRKKNTPKEKAFLFILKVLFHLASFAGLKNAKKRIRYYLFPKPFQEISMESEEGKRLMLATKAASNYSYAFRMAIVKRITDSVQKAYKGALSPSVSLVWDTAHNSIMRERVLGKDVIVHRHTATHTFPGKPVIVSGFNTTNSYLAMGLPESEQHLFSADHGAGETINKFIAEGKTKPHPNNYETLIYRTKQPKVAVSHITNEGIDYVVETLLKEGISSPVVKLRPVAVFKG